MNRILEWIEEQQIKNEKNGISALCSLEYIEPFDTRIKAVNQNESAVAKRETTAHTHTAKGKQTHKMSTQQHKKEKNNKNEHIARKMV